MELKVVYSVSQARRVLWMLLAVEGFLTLAYLLLFVWEAPIRLGPMRRLFDLDAEVALGTWFSTVLLYTIGFVALFGAWVGRHRRAFPAWWMALGGAMFLFLSADEGAAIHERLTGVARALGQDWMLFDGGHGGWILPYLAGGAIGVLALAKPTLRVARNFPRECALGALGAGIVVLGAVGFEVVSYVFLRDHPDETWYKLEVAAEEFCEMAGASLILYAVLLLAGQGRKPDADSRQGIDAFATPKQPAAAAEVE